MPLYQKIKLKTTVLAVRTYLNTLSYISPNKCGKTAFQLFCQPRRGRLDSQDNVFLDSAEKFKIEIEDHVCQCYYWKGEKPAVLLAHGWESNSARWRALIAKLQKNGYAVLAIDGPAHGASNGKYFRPPDYAKCLSQLIQERQPAAVVGHSAGGYAAAYCMAHFSTPSVSKLILMASPATLTQIFNAFLDFVKASQHTRKTFYKYIEYRFKTTVASFDTLHFLKNIKAKGLIIHDENDDLIKYSDAYDQHEHWRESEIFITKGLGHRLRHEQVYDSIIEFLNKN